MKGYEFALRYNVSFQYPYDDQPTPWEPTIENGEFIQRRDRTGRWFSKKINPYNENIYKEQVVSRGEFQSDKRPIYELAMAHYHVRQGLPLDAMKWTERAHKISADEFGVERNGWSLDHLGWGGLTAHRPELCAGDPCCFVDGLPVFAMNSLPGTIEAENFDFYPGVGEMHVYHDLSGTNEGGVYRTTEAVDIESCSEGGFNLSSLEDGEWLNYTVYIPVAGAYNIILRYSSQNENGKIKFEFGGVDKTGEVAIPYGGENSTGFDDWKDFEVAGAVPLEAGVQNMRIYVSGESNAYRLNFFELTFEPSGDPAVNAEAENKDAAIRISWTIENIIPKSVSIYRNTTNDFASSTLFIENIGGSSYVDEDISSDVSYYYWVQVTDKDDHVYRSDAAEAVSQIGLIDDEFEEGLDGWVANTSGASVKAENGQLVMTLAEVKPGVKRGDMKRSQGAVFHAGNYPIFAFKMDTPEVVNITFDTNTGSYGNGANKWTGKLGEDVYYYDLREVGFRGVIPSTTTTTTFDMIQLKVADITSGETEYTCDWVKTFKSVDALKAFLGVTANEQEDLNELSIAVDGTRVSLYNLNENSVVNVYDVLGKKVTYCSVDGNSCVLSLNPEQFYVIIVRSLKGVKSFKIHTVN